jgi:hypothetical protein
LLGTAIEHTLEGLEAADPFVSGDVFGPFRDLLVVRFVGIGWLI